MSLGQSSSSSNYRYYTAPLRSMNQPPLSTNSAYPAFRPVNSSMASQDTYNGSSQLQMNPSQSIWRKPWALLALSLGSIAAGTLAFAYLRKPAAIQQQAEKMENAAEQMVDRSAQPLQTAVEQATINEPEVARVAEPVHRLQAEPQPLAPPESKSVAPEPTVVEETRSPKPLNDGLVDPRLERFARLSQPELKALVHSAMETKKLGSGKDATVHALKDHPDFVLRFTTKAKEWIANNTDALKAVPILHKRKITEMENLGLPSAVLVPAEHRFANRPHIAIEEALNLNGPINSSGAIDPGQVHLWLLKKASGTNPNYLYSHKSALVRGVISEEDKLDPRNPQLLAAAKKRFKAIGGNLELTDTKNYNILKHKLSNIEFEEFSSLIDYLRLSYGKALPHHQLYGDFRQFKFQEKLNMLDDLKRDAYQFGRFTESTPLSKFAQQDFLENYEKFTDAYLKQVHQIANMDQSAYTQAIHDWKALQDSNIHLDFNHPNNTLIDVDKNRIRFVDLNFAPDKTHTFSSLEDFFHILLGKNNQGTPYNWVVRAEERAQLESHVKTMLDKFSKAAQKNQVFFNPNMMDEFFQASQGSRMAA